MTLLLGMVYRIAIARNFTEDDFGKFVFIVVFVAYFSDVSFFGLRGVVVREVAKKLEDYRTFLVQSLRIRSVTTLVAYGAAYGILLIMHKGQDVEYGVALYGLSLFAMAAADIFEGMIIARESSKYVTISTVVSDIVKICVGLWLLHAGFGLLSIILLFVLICFFRLFLDFILFRKAYSGIAPAEIRDDRSERMQIIRESLPFFYMSAISKVYYKNDIVLLSLFKGDKVVGWYGAAYLIVDALLMVANSIATAAYPVMSKSHGNDNESLWQFHSKLSRYLMILFLFIALAVTGAGPELIRLILGDRYAVATPALLILAWMPASEAVTMGMGTLLGAVYEQRTVVKLCLVNAAINFLFCLVLIPWFSYMGAATGTVFSGYIAMFIVIGAVRRKIYAIDCWAVAIKPLLSALGAGSMLYYLKPIIGTTFSVTASVAAYATLLMVTKSLTGDDLKTMQAIFSKKSVKDESPERLRGENG